MQTIVIVARNEVLEIYHETCLISRAELRMYWTYFQNSAKLLKICEIVLFNLPDVPQKF